MWIRKKITLLSDPQLLQGCVLTRETIAEHQQAFTVVHHAEQQARQRLAEAEQQAAAILESAHQRAETALEEQSQQQQQAFLDDAEQLFSHWQEQEQQWQTTLLSQAQSLLTQAMQQLLDELPDATRLDAMLYQLAKAQGRPAAATLICPPSLQQAVESWLATRPQLNWEINTDAVLNSDLLILTTAHGELHLSWSHICQALLPTD